MTDAKSRPGIKMSVVIRSAVLLLVAGPAAWAAGPPVGVYTCYDARMDYKMRLVITPVSVERLAGRA